MESLICSFYLSVAARKIVCADPSLRYTGMLLGRLAANKQTTPTLFTTLDTKDMFYENLASIIRTIPGKEQVFLMSDFNARVGADHDSWPSCDGQFGVGKMNENGQRLLELSTFRDLCITDSFHTKPQHKVSWRHLRSEHCHQLDVILVRRAAINNVSIHALTTVRTAMQTTPWCAVG